MRKSMSGKTTLREVADYAQVHYATASTVLNGSRGSTRVSEETRQRVLIAASELGYSANRAAQQLKTRHSRVVGLLTGNLDNPFFARMATLCSEALGTEGFDVIMATRRENEESDLHLLESLLSRDLAGMLVWCEARTEVYTRLENTETTNVAVMGINIPNRDTVGADVGVGVRAALMHLREQGYEQIGYLAPRWALHRYGDFRHKIYRETMGEWRREVIMVSYDQGEPEVMGARRAAEALVDEMQNRPPRQRPDALLCFNDMNAFGAMMGLRRKGVRVPDDIGLVGCDDVPLASQLDVPLTSIAYPLEPMCKTAVGLLVERIRAGYKSITLAPNAKLLATRLVIRESSLGHGAVNSVDAG